MATLGWKFETLAKTPPITTVTTMVRLTVWSVSPVVKENGKHEFKS
jgi:hypothetical protein